MQFDVEVKGKTEKGLWLRFDDYPDKDVFIPDNQITDDSEIYMKSEIGEIGVVEITEWIAGKKGLI